MTTEQLNTMQMMLQQTADVSTSQSLANSGQAIGAAVGGLAGGVPGAMVGSGVGGALGTIIDSLIPQYTCTRSGGSTNFIGIGIPIASLHLVTPDASTRLGLNDKLNYFGCATNRSELVNWGNYMYNSHGYIQGEFEFDTSMAIAGGVPMDAFRQINAIFKRGVHLIGGGVG